MGYTLEKKFVKTYTVKHVYKNPTEKEVEVWFSLPEESDSQQNITFLTLPTSDEQDEHPFLNTIFYYKVKPNQELTIAYQFDGYAVSLVEGQLNDSIYLTKDETEYYVRSTPLTPVNEELLKEAEGIIQGEENIIEIGRKLYHHILNTYRYSLDFKERGTNSFRQSKKGDCGEFSFLFVSYCRALGIPSRVMMGAWATGNTQPHAWCEFFQDGVGWIPLDISAAATLKQPLRSWTAVSSYGIYPKKEKHFGSIEGKRVAFSIDTHRLLQPSYINNENYDKTYPLYKMGDQMLAWGYESMDGSAPYLQPMYVKFNEQVNKLNVNSLLGKWIVTEPPASQFILSVKQFSLKLAIPLLIISTLVTSFFDASPIFSWLSLIAGMLFVVYIVISVFRREWNIYVLLIGILISFTVLGTLPELVVTWGR
jgi:transglutaminase-like putative cysteine protease